MPLQNLSGRVKMRIAARRKEVEKLANIKSQKKRVITDSKENARNKAVKSNLRTNLKKAQSALAAGADKEEVVSKAFKVIDTAARKGVIHKNNANRKKAAIAKKAAE